MTQTNTGDCYGSRENFYQEFTKWLVAWFYDFGPIISFVVVLYCSPFFYWTVNHFSLILPGFIDS